jgi:hypothetical protein
MTYTRVFIKHGGSYLHPRTHYISRGIIGRIARVINNR